MAESSVLVVNEPAAVDELIRVACSFLSWACLFHVTLVWLDHCFPSGPLLDIRREGFVLFAFLCVSAALAGGERWRP
jgi:hypothetical protein